MQFHLFGAATVSGEAFRRLVAQEAPTDQLLAYSRHQAGAHHAELNDPSGFHPAGERGEPALWISFGPIWLLAPFLAALIRHHPERVQDLRGLIACSSSSTLTKRYAANRFDQDLVARLISAEDSLLESCRQLGVPCHILRPSLIYGQAGPYRDRNLSRLLGLMRRLPVLPLPAETGLRQPIHASQLAAVALRLALHCGASGVEPPPPERLAVGGDTSLSYEAMLRSLQNAVASNDPARRCRLWPVPNRLFWLLAFPLLLRSPKQFEAVLRMAANLAGFSPSHQLLGQPAQPFPVHPLAT